MKNRTLELICGPICILGGIFFGSMFMQMDDKVFATFFGLPMCALGVFLIIGADRFLEFRTANLHEMTAEGVVHSKDKSVHISTYHDSRQSSSQTHNQYLVRVRTPIGFYDAYDKNAYLTYKEDDKVKILVKTRYNRKGKAFRQETIILGLLAPSSN